MNYFQEMTENLYQEIPNKLKAYLSWLCHIMCEGKFYVFKFKTDLTLFKRQWKYWCVFNILSKELLYL